MINQLSERMPAGFQAHFKVVACPIKTKLHAKPPLNITADTETSCGLKPVFKVLEALSR